MAYFGLQWVPKQENEVRPSEADGVQLIAMATEIREKGKQAAEQLYATLTERYNNESHSLGIKKQEAHEWQEYINSRLAALPPHEAEAVGKAAVAWRSGDSAYYDYVRGLSDVAANLVGEYYQMLDSIDLSEKAEADFGALSSELENAQRVNELWAFEAESAKNSHKKLKQEQKDERRKRKDILRRAEKQMNLLRDVNRAGRLQLPRTPHAKASKSVEPSAAESPAEDVTSVLSELDRLTVRSKARPASAQPSPRKEQQPSGGFLQGWFTGHGTEKPKKIKAKDFI